MGDRDEKEIERYTAAGFNLEELRSRGLMRPPIRTPTPPAPLPTAHLVPIQSPPDHTQAPPICTSVGGAAVVPAASYARPASETLVVLDSERETAVVPPPPKKQATMDPTMSKWIETARAELDDDWMEALAACGIPPHVLDNKSFKNAVKKTALKGKDCKYEGLTRKKASTTVLDRLGEKRG